MTLTQRIEKRPDQFSLAERELAIETLRGMASHLMLVNAPKARAYIERADRLERVHMGLLLLNSGR